MISLALAIVLAEHPRPLLYVTSLERRDWKITRDLSPASFRASLSLPVTLVGTNNDLEKLKKALSRDYIHTPGRPLLAAWSS